MYNIFHTNVTICNTNVKTLFVTDCKMQQVTKQKILKYFIEDNKHDKKALKL